MICKYVLKEIANLLNLARQSGDANLTDLVKSTSDANIEIEKSKIQNPKFKISYEPKVTITTQLTANSPTSQQANMLILAIQDNGSGIPEHIKDKIFQPFFTTKPPGQGTGLGLSLAFDIVKAHGGELKVETKLNEGSEFVISLPF
ncbi:MAG: ATP-binding protein [Saprospiraceae bacterium]